MVREKILENPMKQYKELLLLINSDNTAKEVEKIKERE